MRRENHSDQGKRANGSGGSGKAGTKPRLPRAGPRRPAQAPVVPWFPNAERGNRNHSAKRLSSKTRGGEARMTEPDEVIDRVLLAQDFSRLLQEGRDSDENSDENNEATFDQRTMVTAKRKPKQLGQMLLEQGLLSQEQLDGALQEHRNAPKSLGRTLIDLGYIRERDLVRALAEQVGLDFVDLTEHPIDPVAATLLPDQLARRYRAIPIGERDGKLLVAMSDPANVYALDDIRAITNREVQPVVATASDVERAIDKFAGMGDLLAVSQEAEGTGADVVRIARLVVEARTATELEQAITRLREALEELDRAT